MSSRPLLALAPARGFSADQRFSSFGGAGAASSAPEPDPLEQAFSRGYAEGRAEALALADQRIAELEAARQQINLAFARLDEQSASELGERLRQTVLLLCEEAVAPLAIDPEGLRLRIERAVALLQRRQDESRVCLHPEDLALVAGRLPAGLLLEADPSLERGALRVETPDGGVEDGPSQWRAHLAEALRAC